MAQKDQKEKYNKEYGLEQLKQICSRLEKSSKYVRDKLRSWNMEKYAEEFISILTNEKYIDDERFSRAFVNDKWRFQKWGRLKIHYQLKGMQIPENVISRSLISIEEDEYRQMIKIELRKKMESMKITDPNKKRSRLYAFGNQRGYEPDLIIAYLDELI